MIARLEVQESLVSMTARVANDGKLLRRQDQGDATRVCGTLRSLYSPHNSLPRSLRHALFENERTLEVLHLETSLEVGRVPLHGQHPPLQALRHRINHKNDHLIVGQYLESLCGRALSHVRCYPPPMAWQGAARNLASREAKVYERIQDGTSTDTQTNHRYIVATLLGLGDCLVGLVSRPSLLWHKKTTF